MQLLYTLTSYPPAVGGAQIHQHLLARQMKKNADVQVVSHWNQNRSDWLLGTTIRAPKRADNYVIDGIPVHCLGLSPLEKLKMAPLLPIYYPLMRRSLTAISSILENHLHPFAEKADLIHNVRIGREGLTAASLRVARHRDIPFILTPVHHPRWVGWRYQCYTDLYHQADAIFALTQAEKQILIDLQVEPERIYVIGHGPVVLETYNAEAFRLKYKIEDPIVLFLGQHYEYKGYHQVLEATQLVWQKHPNTHFVFVGPAVKDSEKAFMLNPDARIHRLGQVDLQEKTNALAACSFLCLPSTQESFGGVYTEAWMFKKPVIGCNIPAVAEVVDNGINGFLIQQTPKQISQSILKLLDNPDLASSMGAKGYEKVQKFYTWSVIEQKAKAAYN
ncbi:MAG: glycosyltransferase family 4 protein, partial [Phormidesmis sp.]